jgi:hypothetical protein
MSTPISGEEVRRDKAEALTTAAAPPPVLPPLFLAGSAFCLSSNSRSRVFGLGGGGELLPFPPPRWAAAAAFIFS